MSTPTDDISKLASPAAEGTNGAETTPVAISSISGLKKTPMTTERKTRKNSTGQFAKGASGNPTGRPPGSLNKATLLMEALLEGDAEQLTRKGIELALAGEPIALRMCWDRILPPRRDRPIHLNLGPVENPQQISAAGSKVVEAIGDGRITPNEGETLANVLAVQTNVVATADLESRLEQLEQARFTDQKLDQGAVAEEVIRKLQERRAPPVVNHDESESAHPTPGTPAAGRKS
jgi:hypothetical protein